MDFDDPQHPTGRQIMVQDHDLAAALTAWAGRLGADRMTTERVDLRDTSALSRRVPALLRPRTETDVVDIVRIAARHRVPLYPISTGHNWGYGGALPALDDCVLVDLSDMTGVAIDGALGIATLEPGVTQQGLRDHLSAHGLPFMVPVTGAGPTCSLVGNALERGYGITPIADHFTAVTAIRAVLPDGSIYVGPLTQAGGPLVDRLHKWGVGPYLDGLFAQGAFGIVTQMTIALARRPPLIEAFLFELPEDRSLEGTVDAVRTLLQTASGGLSGINLLNRRRVLSMVVPYPADQVAPGAIMPDDLAADLARRHSVPPWMGLGALYGEVPVVRALRRVVRQRLAPHVRRLTFLSEGRAQKLGRLLRFVPGPRGAGLRERLAKVSETLDILAGRPRETALSLAYWRSGTRPSDGTPMNPARDGCGLMWYAPLVPMTGESARAYVDMVHDICPRFGIEPLITLTSVNERCFDSTVPLLFDPASETDRAHACYDALFEAGRGLGFLPYRMSVRAMTRYTADRNSTYWEMVRTLKRAVDPDGIIAPGRYASAD